MLSIFWLKRIVSEQIMRLFFDIDVESSNVCSKSVSSFRIILRRDHLKWNFYNVFFKIENKTIYNTIHVNHNRYEISLLQKIPGSVSSSRHEFLQLMNHCSRMCGSLVKSVPCNAFVATITWGEQFPNKFIATIAGHFFGFSFRALTKLVELYLSFSNVIVRVQQVYR